MEDEITLAGLHKRVQKLEDQMPALEKAINENTGITRQIANDTAAMVEFTKAMEGVGKLVKWCSRMARPFIYIFGAIGAAATAWFAIKGGTPPSVK